MDFAHRLVAAAVGCYQTVFVCAFLVVHVLVNNNSSFISSFYSGTKLNGAWDSGATWNREHTWPKSKSTGSQRDDIMMLRPTAVTENSSRGNKAYGESDGYFNPNTYVGSTGLDLRGDCARIALYCYVRWTENAGQMWGTDGEIESVELLLN
ncbi:MAG: endonuclease, partial [Bacteroidales bacterium]|nr:endonuclease [Bacteroidales bacterium]